MSGKTSISSEASKELWQVEFENESVNEEKWRCIVTAFMETKAEDEEYIRILSQYVADGKIPVVQIITQSDLIDLLKNYEKPVKNKKITELKDVNKPEGKIENEENYGSYSDFGSNSRFQQVVSLVSDYAKFSEGQFKMPPAIMAYALKYIILEKKCKNYYKKRLVNSLERKEREEKIKAEIIRNLDGLTEEKIPEEKSENGLEKMWARKKFDILEGSPCRDGPYNGPDIYIILFGFYDPLYFVHLLKINVPFVAVIKMENCEPIMRHIPSGSSFKKMEWINYFWTEFDKGVTEGKTTALYKEIALLKFTPSFSSHHTVEDKTGILTNGIAAVLFTAYNLYRLHKTFLQNMEVQRMIESLEPLELSRCEIYNRLCDALIADNTNAEIFVLFSMIEQVAAGVPPTRERILEYKRQSSEFFRSDPESIPDPIPTIPTLREIGEEPPINLDSLTDISQKRNMKNINNPNIYLYDDAISLGIANIDRNILKTDDLFKRFVINCVLLKIQNKYPVLTKAEKTESDFQFFRIWEKSKENPEIFKIKLFFSVVMRLIERTQNFKESSQDLSIRSLDGTGSATSDEKNMKNPSFISLPDEKPDSENLFQQLDDLFYKETGFSAQIVEKSTKATLELRKGKGAITGLTAIKSDSHEDFDITCAPCGTLKENKSIPKSSIHDAIHLEQLLEPYQISNLNEPNLLVNRRDFNDFVRKHYFYEVLEPNRIVQRLQHLCDNYNTAEWTYFSPTDTLFVLGYNDADFRGVHHSRDYGFIASPVSLRDFCIYILPKNKKWLRRENSEFIEFLENLAEKVAGEKEKMENRLKCEFLKRYCSADEREKERNERGGRDSKMKSSTEKKREEMTEELDDLPKKEKRPRPKLLCFRGINCEQVLTLVTVLNSEFHSKDGSVVRARTLSWLYAGKLVTLLVERAGFELYLNRLEEETTVTESLHLRDSSGALFTFDTQRSIPYLSRITRPNGLIIRPVPLNGSTSIYIRQQYLDTYRLKQDLSNESFRCYLPNGQVLIFKKDETICVFCPSGTKYHCRIRVKDKKGNLTSKTKDEKGDFEKFCIKIDGIVNPTGEIYSWNECMKPENPKKEIKSGDFTGEIFYRMEDGTFATLWPDGKLVTSYPDGTKITSVPEFEELDIFSGEDTESEPENGKKENFEEGPFETEEWEGFSFVTCSYLLEHPKYAAVFFKNSVTEIRENGKANVTLSPSVNYVIKSRDSVLKAFSEGARFYNFCKRCGNKSSSTIRLHSPHRSIISDTRDFYNKRFVVYGSGQVLYEDDKEDGLVPEREEKAPEEPFRSANGRQKHSEYCRHRRNLRPRQKCLIFERDLTGMEFIEENSLYRYIGSLSEDAYYDLFRISGDGNTLHHGFFQPIHNPFPQRNIIEYEKNDAYPNGITRRQIKGKESSGIYKKKNKGPPRTIVARFIRVLPSDPLQILRKISIAISLCQQRASQVGLYYRKCSHTKTETPFRNYVTEKLSFIATCINLFKPLNLYSNTCIALPQTEFEIHSGIHNRNLNNYFSQFDPDNIKANILPRCKQICKPLKHYARDKEIAEDPESDSS